MNPKMKKKKKIKKAQQCSNCGSLQYSHNMSSHLQTCKPNNTTTSDTLAESVAYEEPKTLLGKSIWVTKPAEINWHEISVNTNTSWGYSWDDGFGKKQYVSKKKTNPPKPKRNSEPVPGEIISEGCGHEGASAYSPCPTCTPEQR